MPSHKQALFPLALGVALLATADLTPSVASESPNMPSTSSSAAALAPRAAVRPRVFREHGNERVDNYYWLRDDGQIYMLLIYPKSKKDDLTDRETALLREFVKEL